MRKEESIEITLTCHGLCDKIHQHKYLGEKQWLGVAFLCLFLKGFQTSVQPAAQEVIPARTQAPSSLLQTSGPPVSLFMVEKEEI